jgi:hypothetical protein
MPKKKQNTYVVEGHKQKSWEAACAYATDLSLQQEGNPVTIVEHGQTGTYYINVQATAEPA